MHLLLVSHREAELGVTVDRRSSGPGRDCEMLMF